jgi:hypothetical protein
LKLKIVEYEGKSMLRLVIKINSRTIYNIEAVRTKSKTTPRDEIEVLVADYDVTETVNQFRFRHRDHIVQDGALVLGQALLEKVVEKEAKLK